MHNCNDTYAKLPPSVGSFPNATSDGTLPFYLLPFVEQDNLYKLGDDGAGNFSVWNKDVYSHQVAMFVCPNDTSGGAQHMYDGWLATTNYASNFLVFGLGGASIPATFQDGTSNTIVLAERYQMCNRTPCGWAHSAESEWAPIFAYSSVAKFQSQPAQAQCNPALAQRIHGGGINVALGDGSVRNLQDVISPETWYYALTPAGGEVLGADW
jgi:prepilin-type processing-associated H-X9-DG protein